MGELDKFAELYKTAETDLYERGNYYKTNESSKSTLREIRLCSPDNFKYEYGKIKKELQKVANEEKEKYEQESENLRSRLKNCYNYYDIYQYYVQKNNNLKKVKLNLVNNMTDQIFHSKPTIEIKPKFNQLDNELTQYIHDCDTIENKVIDKEKHIEFIKGLSKTFDQSIKRITKKDIKRLYEKGTVVSIAKKRSKFFNEMKEDIIINRTIMKAVNKINKELKRLDEKENIDHTEDTISKGHIKRNISKGKQTEKEVTRNLSLDERKRNSAMGTDLSDRMKVSEKYMKENKNKKISITQIKQEYDKPDKYVRKGNGFIPSLNVTRIVSGKSDYEFNCIAENSFKSNESTRDEFGNLPSIYKSNQSKNSIINSLYPEEKEILSKNKNLRNSIDNTFIFQLIRPYRAFKTFSTFMLKEICKIITVKIFKQNHIIYNKGDSVRSWYIILEGSVGLYGMNNNQLIPLLTFSDDEDFGKISLFTESPQNYTAKVISDVCLIAYIDKETYLHIMQWMLKYEVLANQKFFKSLPDFSNVPDPIIERMSNICHTIKYTAGSTILKENNYIRYIYFIQSGTCELYTSLEVDVNQEMKYVIAKYSGYGSKYDMPKYTDPYGRRIVTESAKEVESESEVDTENSSGYSSFYELNGISMEKDNKKKRK
jgi:CRP-like cAMP-binding protein